MIEIRRYKKEDEAKLMKLLCDQGEEWECYTANHVFDSYCKLLFESMTYVAMDKEEVVAYSRSLKDGDFYIYVCDLLVTLEYRGNQIGHQLLNRICSDYSNHTVYVMSDVDEYYSKQDYKKEGSIFLVTSS